MDSWKGEWNRERQRRGVREEGEERKKNKRGDGDRKEEWTRANGGAKEGVFMNKQKEQKKTEKRENKRVTERTEGEKNLTEKEMEIENKRECKK